MLEIGAIVALLAAGLFLWQVRRTLRAELQWAQEAEASVNAYATATHGADDVTEEALRRVRIPTLGIDYRLGTESLQAAPEADNQDSLRLALPVDVYGDGVCGLARLQPGDTVYLETVHRGFSYQVLAGDGQSGKVTGSLPRVELVGYPCGDGGNSVMVSAIRTSH